MSKEGKSSKAEICKRVSRIFELMTQGFFDFEIVQNVSNNEGWNVSDRQIYNYISKANEMFSDYAKIKRDIELGKAITRLNVLFNKSLKVQDYKTCLMIQKEINTLMGNYPAK